MEEFGLELIANKHKLVKKKPESKSIAIYDKLSKMNPIIVSAIEQNPIILANPDKFMVFLEKKLKEIIKHYGTGKTD